MLESRERLGNLRTLPPERQLIDFASNDYLGLARSAILAELVQGEWRRLGRPLGSTGSRLLTGNSGYVEQLEEELAQAHGAPAALLFGCGYLANLGVLALARRGSVLFDVQSHASLRDGIRLSGALAFPFRHHDLNHLELRLRRTPAPHWICVESIDSTDGSRAPLQQLEQLVLRYEAQLVVDEAHAVGVFGYGLATTLPRVVTFGKAFGAYGAMVLCTAAMKRLLVNFARSFIYTTALPFHALATIRCVYQLLPTIDLAHLHRLMTLFPVASPIQTVLIPGNGQVRTASQRLASQGFDVRPLMSPTVQRGRERLRISLHTFNSWHNVIALKQCIEQL